MYALVHASKNFVHVVNVCFLVFYVFSKALYEGSNITQQYSMLFQLQAYLTLERTCFRDDIIFVHRFGGWEGKRRASHSVHAHVMN